MTLRQTFTNVKFSDISFQHWDVFVHVSEVFILVPSLLGLKGNLEMTLASRLSTQASTNHTRNNISLSNVRIL